MGYKAWEFSYYSLFQTYGHTFLRRVVLRHPWRVVQGLAIYYRLMPRLRDDGLLLLSPVSEEAFLRQVVGQEPGRFLVAVGFCQKPLAAGNLSGGCPAGRFNHDCLVLMKGGIKGDKSPLETTALMAQAIAFNGRTELETKGPACACCDISLIAEHALAAGAGLYIMTTAQDIALDLLIPSLENGRFKHVLMFLCPMSVRAIILPLLICGLSGFLVAYERGSCDNYARWLQADRGYKPEQTGLRPERLQRALAVLQRLAEERKALSGPTAFAWKRQGNAYMPVAEKCDPFGASSPLTAPPAVI